MPQLAVSEFSTYRWTLEQELTEFARRGIGGIGLWRSKVSDLEPDAACDLLYEHRIGVSSLSWAGGFTGSCGHSFEEAVQDTLEAVRTAAGLGARCLIVHSGARNGHTRKHARRLLKTALDRTLPVAADYGVRLALEPMQAPESQCWTIADSYEETLELIEVYPESRLGVVLDLYHVGREMTLLQAIPELAPRIALVQLADRRMDVPGEQNRCLLELGEIPVATWVRQLLAAGYEGYFELEIHGQDVEHLPYRQVLDHSLVAWQRMRGPLDETTGRRRTAGLGHG